jgi:hypothetical protein
MSGIDFVTDERGKKKAVLIDLRKHGQLWEDIYDSFVCESRKKDSRESLESVRRRIKAKRAAHA